jgi:hypothetical protein
MCFSAGWVSEGRDNVPESEKSAIDRNTFLDTLSNGCRTLELEEKVLDAKLKVK